MDFERNELISQDFYERDTIQVARELLGQLLVRSWSDGTWTVCRVVETEAYLGLEDPCCHSFSGQSTSRTVTMFGPKGRAYVYLIYGMYHCFNVVTGHEGQPEAILIRALEPLFGLDMVQKNRPRVHKQEALLNGPGKLCMGLALNRKHDGLDVSSDASTVFLLRSRFWREAELDTEVNVSARVGLPAHKDAAGWPLRFQLLGSRFCSPQKTLS